MNEKALWAVSRPHRVAMAEPHQRHHTRQTVMLAIAFLVVLLASYGR